MMSSAIIAQSGVGKKNKQKRPTFEPGAKKTLPSKNSSSVFVPHVHEKIQRECDRLARLFAEEPGYRPGASDAPNILKLVRAAVAYANHSRGLGSTPKSFMYFGKRYQLLYTNLGRLIVTDKKGTKIGGSGYDAIL